MKIVVTWAFIILVLYAAQTSLLTFITYNGFGANLMLLLIVSVAFLKGHRHGVFFGFVTGLLQDLTSGSFFGCVIFSYMTVGFLFGKFSKHIFREQFFLPILSSIVAITIHLIIMTGFIILLGYEPDAAKIFQTGLLPLIFFQLAFAYPIHKMVYSFDKFVKRHN